jgi:RNA polymerase sigma factor (sigma-70 family)
VRAANRTGRGCVQRARSDPARRDREVVRLRYEEDLLRREIGERIGLPQTHVSRILRSSIRTMRQVAGTAA